MSFIEGGPKPLGRKGARSLLDRLPGSERRREKERRKNDLIQAFMIKAIQDVEDDGFSIKKKDRYYACPFYLINFGE